MVLSVAEREIAVGGGGEEVAGLGDGDAGEEGADGGVEDVGLEGLGFRGAEGVGDESPDGCGSWVGLVIWRLQRVRLRVTDADEELGEVKETGMLVESIMHHLVESVCPSVIMCKILTCVASSMYILGVGNWAGNRVGEPPPPAPHFFASKLAYV